MGIIKCNDLPLNVYLIKGCVALTLHFFLYYSAISVPEIVKICINCSSAMFNFLDMLQSFSGRVFFPHV